ncbi:MAG: ATP-dependent RecD-like DNA helicase, partial [bacterium]|nr:ATP-dependent RecD-like DNA helicase [bacterium]
GVSSGYATKIYKQYENESIAIVKENPYRLADDIFGIGFQVADAIAGKLGFSKDSSLRIESGILYVLKNLSNNGNVFYPESLLLRESLSVLGIQNNEILNDALESLKKNKKVIIEEINEREKAVYLSSFFYAERTIAHKIKDLLNEPTEEKKAGTKESIEWVQKELSINLAENQVTAVERALQSKVMIITGGPGTGKTTIINSILKIFSKENINIMLAAPTGRAAKRMSEATGYEAKTIHRLLEYNPRQGGFQINEDNLLDCDLLIVDEASMIDTLLMNSLLKGMPVQTTFILVGDVNQLPSVGAGNVLKDVIESGAIPVVELNEIFRQAKESNIIVNAHKINHGELPDLTVKENTDFYFINKNESGTIANTIIQLVQSNIPAKFNYNAVDDIQVLTPMHKGDIGTMVLNERLQEALNPGKTALKRGDKSFRVKDKVMQIKNNYDKEVYNGDIGRISSVDAEEQLVVINFDGKFVEYDYGELDEIVLAYAVTVHKSQGSEYPVIVMPLHAQQYVMLQRNLVYTGITRGKELVILVGTKHALSAAVKNNESRKRYTRLAYRLGKRVE